MSIAVLLPRRFERRASARAQRGVAALLMRWVLLGLICVLLSHTQVQAQGIELTALKTERVDDGLTVSFTTLYDLPKPVEDALVKNLLPVYFVVEASVYRSRWYWRDVRVARVNRSWRLTWQPLTGKYRVSLGILSQTYPTLAEALNSMRSVSAWRIADLSQLEDDGKYYLEFSYKLDTSQLPRPMQIGLGSPEGWAISVTRNMGIDLSPRSPP